MRLHAAVGSVAVASVLFAGRADASPDPYSPNQLPPPPSFYAGYAPVSVSTSYVPRSPFVRTLGVVFIVVGGVALVSAPIVGTAGTSSGSDPLAPAPTDGAVIALAVSGLGLLLVGIPAAVYGSQMVPPPAVTAYGVRVEPAGAGLRLRF